MKKLNLRSKATVSFVEIPVRFIDKYLPEAPEEALKVYLYLLRVSGDPSVILSVNDMADLFEITPKKVFLALSYWESLGLMALDYSDGEISDITLLEIPEGSEEPAVSEAVLPSPVPANIETLPAFTEKPVLLPIDRDALDEDPAYQDLLALSEFYLKKPLTSTMRETIGTAYVTLNRDYKLTEYLIEYCIERGHTSPHYLKAVAEGWQSEGYQSIEEAKAMLQNRDKSVYRILGALGIKGREPVQSETDYMVSWQKDFELPLILEACNRTMASLHAPNFEYVNAILTKWKTNGIQALSDIAALDRKHSEKAEDSASRQKKDSFRNFDERKTDLQDLFRKYVES